MSISIVGLDLINDLSQKRMNSHPPSSSSEDSPPKVEAHEKVIFSYSRHVFYFNLKYFCFLHYFYDKFFRKYIKCHNIKEQKNRECTPPYLSTGISNLLQPAQAEVVLGQLSTYLVSWVRRPQCTASAV